MYNSEETFIDAFIACLAKLGIKTIPFDDEDFYDGIDCMKQYYTTNKFELGEYQDEIGMLFIKNPIEGVYARFRNVLSKQNGGLISFANPEYVIATINIDKNGANYVIKHSDIDIDFKHLNEFTKLFCKGAKLSCNC